MELVIMAAGMGSRFGGLKQIEPINKYDEFIIDYSIYDAIRVGFDKVVFIIKEENYDVFRETVGKRVEKQISVEYVFQRLEDIPAGFSVPGGRVKPWGTAHAILCCKHSVHNNFVIINADDFYGKNAFEVIGNALKNSLSENAFYLAGYRVKNTLTDNGAVKRGVCNVENGYLTKIVECSIESNNGKIIACPLNGAESFEVKPESPVSMNMFGFTPMIFNYLEKRFVQFLSNLKYSKDPLKAEFLIPDIVDEMVEHNIATVKVLDTTAVWHGVTYKEDKEEVVNAIADLVKAGEYPEKLWNN